MTCSSLRQLRLKKKNFQVGGNHVLTTEFSITAKVALVFPGHQNLLTPLELSPDFMREFHVSSKCSQIYFIQSDSVHWIWVFTKMLKMCIIQISIKKKYVPSQYLKDILIYKMQTWVLYSPVLLKKLLCLGDSILATSWYEYIDTEFLIEIYIYIYSSPWNKLWTRSIKVQFTKNQLSSTILLNTGEFYFISELPDLEQFY